jgi:hypothetical protein
MKKLLATTAVVTVAFAGAASAQSVLERVLTQISNDTNLASVNGTFANIAENIGGGATTNYMDSDGDISSAAQYDTGLANEIDAANDRIKSTTGATDSSTNTTYAGSDAYWFDENNDGIVNSSETRRDSSIGDLANSLEEDVTASYAAGFTAFQVSDGGINGSITNIIDGITEATQTAVSGSEGGVTAIEYNMPTVNFGNLATTALGAVNTGDITLGVNSTVDDAKTTSTQAVSSVMAQLGGSSDSGAIVLNIASNMTGINGSISNTMTEVNGTVGTVSTTALGAVNTGTIISGVNAAVQGITGTSGQSNGMGTADPVDTTDPAPAP